MEYAKITNVFALMDILEKIVLYTNALIIVLNMVLVTVKQENVLAIRDFMD